MCCMPSCTLTNCSLPASIILDVDIFLKLSRMISKTPSLLRLGATLAALIPATAISSSDKNLSIALLAT